MDLVHNRLVTLAAALGMLLGTGFVCAQGQTDEIGLSAPATPVDSNLSASIKSFFGTSRSSYLPIDGSIYEQFSSVFSGDRASDRKMHDGDELLSSSLKDSPSVRAALLLGPDGDIKAAALLHYHCKSSETSGSFICDDAAHPTLTVFLSTYSKGDTLTNEFVISKLRGWARRGVKKDIYGTGQGAVDMKVQVRRLSAQK